jgi:hypothetical protein
MGVVVHTDKQQYGCNQAFDNNNGGALGVVGLNMIQLQKNQAGNSKHYAGINKIVGEGEMKISIEIGYLVVL